MYWSDYIESIDFDSTTGQFQLYARYALGDKSINREGVVAKASVAPALFLQWRNEFKASLKPAPQEQAAA